MSFVRRFRAFGGYPTRRVATFSNTFVFERASTVSVESACSDVTPTPAALSKI
jgi:hypothetical protein